MSWELHAVVIDKNAYTLEHATKIARDIIKNPKRNFIRETTDSYRFRNIPKTKFPSKVFRSKVINPNITLVFGKMEN
jgi:hypothetical protein